MNWTFKNGLLPSRTTVADTSLTGQAQMSRRFQPDEGVDIFWRVLILINYP
jgi:hypothetical protein